MGTVPPTQEIMLFTGSSGSLREAPASQLLNLGDAWLNESQSWKFTVFNGGGSQLQLTGANLAPGSDFEMNVDPIGGIFGNSLLIEPGEVAYVTVRTQFTSAGTKNGTLRILSNDADEATYSLPLRFNATPRPAPLGLKIRRENGVVVLTYPPYQFFSFQVERSTSLNGVNAWEPQGFMSAEFDVATQSNVMVWRDYSPPGPRAYYRVRLD